MNVNMKTRLMSGNLGNILRVPKANPFPGVIYAFMGRDALSLSVSYLNLGTDDRVLLPAYLCLEALKPFLRKTRVEFYELEPDLTIDPEEIKKRLARDKVKMVMIINYFGFLQPYRKEIRKICADRGIILMEDCAHSLLTEGSGEIGDLSIYSFGKILPLPDGGGLKISTETKPFTPEYYPQSYSNILSVLIMLKSLFNVRAEIFSRAWATSRTKNRAPNAISNKKSSRILPISSFAYNGIGNISFTEIIEKRRSDYQFWQESADKSNLIKPFFRGLLSGVCPLGFPVWVKDRDKLKSRLQKEAIYLKVHWHLPETVGKEFVNSHDLSAHMLTFPVYPELSKRERDGIRRLLSS